MIIDSIVLLGVHRLRDRCDAGRCGRRQGAVVAMVRDSGGKFLMEVVKVDGR